MVGGGILSLYLEGKVQGDVLRGVGTDIACEDLEPSAVSITNFLNLHSLLS